MFSYAEVFSRLTFETASIIFIKKDGTPRVMLATRNLRTAEIEYGFLGRQLGGHDNRCNIKNGNLAVIDLALGEPRSFSIDRLISVNYYGVIDTKDKLEEATKDYLEFKRGYEKSQQSELTMDMLD